MSTIRTSTAADWEAIATCHRDAFGEDEGPEIVELVDHLLQDASVEPRLSLVAESSDGVVGHVLFTPVRVGPSEASEASPRASILAPLAVAPSRQRQGVGGQLTREGLARLKAAGIELVFVLGHPSYYPKFGFRPAGAQGFDAPHPIAPENADAWMVLALGDAGDYRGRVECASILNDARYW